MEKHPPRIHYPGWASDGQIRRVPITIPDPKCQTQQVCPHPAVNETIQFFGCPTPGVPETARVTNAGPEAAFPAKERDFVNYSVDFDNA